MPSGVTTARALQNETTGIDMLVPLYQEVRGAMMSGHVEYQIVVVTRLATFKSPRHRVGDIVQLMVSKKYSDIDELYHRLVSKYPKITLPAMPRKALFVGEADIRERRAAFDELMKFMAKDPTLAICPEVLEFLGGRTTEADLRSRNVLLGEEADEEDEEEVNFFQIDEVSTASSERVLEPRKCSKGETFNEVDDEEDGEEVEMPFLGPLGDTKCSEKTKPALKTKPQPQKPADTDLFHIRKKGNLKLFDDPDLGGTVTLRDSLLLLPTTYEKKGTSAGLELDEDVDALFRVEEDFNKLLQVTKQLKDKPASRPKPDLKPKPTGKALAPKTRLGASPRTPELKDQMDVLKYIQQNELDATWSEDLF